MKKLFCVVVNDVSEMLGLEGPIIFHIKGNNKVQVEDAVNELLEQEYGFSFTVVDELDIITFELTEDEIIELDTLED